MAEYRRHVAEARQPRLVRWLWFLAAYLTVIVLIASLAYYVAAPGTPDIGWAE